MEFELFSRFMKEEHTLPHLQSVDDGLFIGRQVSHPTVLDLSILGGDAVAFMRYEEQHQTRLSVLTTSARR